MTSLIDIKSSDAGERPHAVHIWFGPFGLHVFLPDVWHSRFDWCAKWRETA